MTFAEELHLLPDVSVLAAEGLIETVSYQDPHAHVLLPEEESG
jgi:hypothetical protein